jgi:molybdate transport system permease protein
VTDAEQAVLLLSLRVAVAAVLVSLPAALFFAWLLARRRFPGKLLLDSVLHLPLVLPPVVTGYLLLVTFGGQAPLGAFLEGTLGLRFAFDWKGAALASAVLGFPLMLRAIRLSIESIDPRLEQAARTLGAGRARTFAAVTLPLALPGILTGALLAFARSLGEFGATITFVSNIEGQTRTLPLAIYTLLNQPGGEARVLRLVGLSFLLALGAMVAGEWLARRLRGGRS